MPKNNSRSFGLAVSGTDYVKPRSTVAVSELPAPVRVRPFEIVIGDPGAASALMAYDNDSQFVCADLTGTALTISKIQCQYLPAGGTAPVINAAVTGGSDIAASNRTCVSGSFTSTTPFECHESGNGQSIDGNIITAGTAKYIVVRIRSL